MSPTSKQPTNYEQWQIGFKNDPILFQPTHGSDVYYNYRQLTVKDGNGNKSIINFNLLMQDGNLIIEKVIGDSLIGRITVINSKDVIKDLNANDRAEFNLIHLEYDLWKKFYSPDALEEKRKSEEFSRACKETMKKIEESSERLTEEIDNSIVMKLGTILFIKTPQMVVDSAKEVSKVFFLSLAYVKCCSFGRSFNSVQATNSTHSRIVSENNNKSDQNEVVHLTSNKKQSLLYQKSFQNSFYNQFTSQYALRNNPMRNNLLPVRRLEAPKFSKLTGKSFFSRLESKISNIRKTFN